MAVVKVLFVCTGNICRSPTAHGIFRARAREAGLNAAVLADSAGTHGYHQGEPPDRRAVAMARSRGIDIADLRARQVVAADFAEFDFILALDEGHLDVLRRRCPEALRSRIHLLMDFAAGRTGEEVPDPYYGEFGFSEVFSMIDEAVSGLIDHLRREKLV